jgi:hypothetical protein
LTAATQALLAACTAHNTSLYGALAASCFRAVAASKKTGPCSETYSITTMVNCRAELREPLRDDDIGFFHSALMHHHSVAEMTKLWELAGRCSATLERALQEDKHFKDMGVLNMLFYQVGAKKLHTERLWSRVAVCTGRFGFKLYSDCIFCLFSGDMRRCAVANVRGFVWKDKFPAEG